MKELKQKIGSLCLFGFDGLTVPDWIRRVIVEDQLAGVILFKRNIESKEQLRELIHELKSLRKGPPLLVSVDHEGGRVFRLPPPFTQIPTAREIGGRHGDLPLQIGQLMGRELREVGFNLNFAPVLDVDSNPNNPIIGDRAFSSDPHQVARAALELAQGLRSEGVLPCGKHFPGHGDTSKDSHLELPVVDHPPSRIRSLELLPFQEAIKNQIEMLMTAHVLYPQIDADYPATLSQKIISGLLRQEMGYDGLVISDDFNMKAIADRYGIPEAAELFWKAGGDLILVCRYQEICEPLLESLLKRVGDGAIPLEMIEVSRKRLTRILSNLSP